jgi:transposase-like protein
MILENTAEADSARMAPCPRCTTGMVLAAVTPHPKNDRMERHTYLCAVCNQTRTYVLPAA